MAVSEVAIEEKLCQFIKEYADGQYCLLELLRFWGRHPNTRFSQLAIVHALDSRRLYVETALKHLINEGIIKTYIENGDFRYSLTEDEELRNLVLDLARLNWCQWQLMLGQMYPSSE